MASTREILTIQSGNYSNHIGAHWWNIQESYFQSDPENPSEICHDVLYREGKTLHGQTFTPRLLVFDKRENTIHLPTISEPITRTFPTTWDSARVSTEYQPVPEKHPFILDLEQIERGNFIDVSHKDYKFNETVRTWCDYLKTKFHPKTQCLTENNMKMDVFHSGTDFYNSVEELITDNIRTYVEECDNIQGFHITADAVDGFGGLASSILVHLEDEYSSKTKFTFPTISSYYNDPNPMDDVHRMINTLLSYQKLSESSDIVVPISTNKTAWKTLGQPEEFPHLIYDQKIHYETSAILASYLDTVTLKYRLRNDHLSIYDVVSGLSFSGRKICAASISLPFPMAPKSYLLDTLENLDESQPLWNRLTPGCNIDNDKIFYQVITMRGIPIERLRNPEVLRSDNRAFSCTAVEELIHLYLSYRASAISNVFSASIPLKTSTPFPKIFSPHVSCLGSVDGSATRADGFDVASSPTLSGIHSCKDVGRMLDSLHHSVKSINIKKFHEYLDTDMDFDEYNECLEKILTMCYAYQSDLD